MNLVAKITNTEVLNVNDISDKQTKCLYEKITGDNIDNLDNVSKNERLLLSEISQLTHEVNEMAKMYLTSTEGEACFR